MKHKLKKRDEETHKSTNKLKRKLDDGRSRKKKSNIKRKKRSISASSSSSTCSSSSTSSSSSSSSDYRASKSKSKIKKHRKKRNSTSSSSSSESPEEILHKKRHVKKKKKHRRCSPSSSSRSEEAPKKSKSKPGKIEPNDEPSMDIPLALMDSKSKSLAPMTKEEWEKKQSVIRRVYDESTGRHRLIKGDGEVLEEIVSRERHKEINRNATKGDGDYFETKLSQSLNKR
ncbi:unnamed protein product [Phyllotreta striolata]|uniref:ADP-ribosylation factor-like protein 6-interacting protein 4 n=1 Tax=Phyllotreta striolata TaxID=444603 RepID=A0A9N9XK97_PHYSR|nr:unnamed protein product [Phyllotreta striolata]